LGGDLCRGRCQVCRRSGGGGKESGAALIEATVAALAQLYADFASAQLRVGAP
jgi:hypothetical protein